MKLKIMGAFMMMLAFSCSKSSDSASAASSGGSGLDGTGVITMQSPTAIDVLSAHNSAANRVGSVSVPSDAKALYLMIHYNVATGATATPAGTGAARFNLYVTDGTNELGRSHSVQISSGAAMEESEFVLWPIYAPSTIDLRNKTVGFYHSTTNGMALSATTGGGTYIQVNVIGIVR